MRYKVAIPLGIMFLWSVSAAAELEIVFRISEDDPNANSDVVSSVAYRPTVKRLPPATVDTSACCKSRGPDRPSSGMRGLASDGSRFPVTAMA